MDKPLLGLSILVTRPAHQAQPLCKLIENYGGTAHLFPTITIKAPHDHNTFTQIVRQIDSFDIAIFVSQNAVNATLPLWPRQSTSSLAIIAIGPGTQATLQKNNFQVNCIPTHFSSEGLLALPELQTVNNKSIVIFSGENTRPFLKGELQQRGATVTQAIGYRRECPHVSDTELRSQLSHSFNFIVSTSQESLHNFITLFSKWPAWLYQQRLLVINDTMEKLARSHGFTRTPLVANNASDQAIINALAKHTN